MKRIFLLLPLCLMLIMCNSAKTSGTSTTTIEKGAANDKYVLYSDNFKAATQPETNTLLKELKATEDDYSVLTLTKNFAGSEITVTTAGKQVYKGYPITGKANKIAQRIRISNTTDTEVYDAYSKQSVMLTASDVKKHKFIYIAKTPSTEKPFVVLFSTKLQAVK